MNSLFGLQLPTPVNLVIAFVVVLVLIGAAAWIVRRLGAAHLDAAARGRPPRLAVLDTAAVDARRKLVIIRRDNVEHLIMIGGPTDVVVETNIVRAAAVRETTLARNGSAEIGSRAAVQPEPWPIQPEPEPAPAVAVRAERSPRAVGDMAPQWPSAVEPAATSPLAARAAGSAEPLSGAESEPPRPATPEPVAPAARVAPPEPAHTAAQPATAGAPGAPTSDRNIAAMAQRLEAALRRSGTQGAQPDAAPARVAVAAEGKPTARPESRFTVAQGGRGSVQPKPQAPADLEQEMASLLGRPGKT